MDIFNTREIAIALWLILIFVYIFLSSRMADARRAIKNVFSAFFVKRIVSVLVLMFVYMAFVIYCIFELGLWNIDQLKNTIFWFASVGFMSLFKIEKIKQNNSFFKYAVIDNLKLLAIFQFVVSVYTFSLLIEFLLVPVLVLVGAMLAIVDTDKKYNQVKKILEYCLSFFGAILIFYTLYMLVTNFDGFGNEKTAYDFFIPPLLTFFYLPFLFIILVYSTYEQVFIRLKFSIKNTFYRKLAKLYAAIFFNVRISLLDRWSYTVSRVSIESHRDLVESFRSIFRATSAEKKPKNVPIELGWSPYKAKDFLLDEGFNTGFYDWVFEEEWLAFSEIKKLDDGIIPDNIYYCVSGSEKFAKKLEIIINITDAARSNKALEYLLELAEYLSFSSLNQYLSDEMKNSVIQGKQYSENSGSKIISLTLDKWPNHAFNGYELKFIILSIP